MNIAKILKNCPKGRELYCTAFGVIRYIGMAGDKIKFRRPDGYDVTTENDGRMVQRENVECIIFPSFKCRDWNDWAEVLINEGDIVKLNDGRVVRYCFSEHAFKHVERFAESSEMFKKGDAVLCRNSDKDTWTAAVFIETDTVLTDMPFHVWFGIANVHYSQCIPFLGNEEKIGKV
jgi:hypothetical protein